MRKNFISLFFALLAFSFVFPAFCEENPTAELPKFVDFGAKKCKACKMLEPVIEELKNEYSEVLSVEFVDVWLAENEARATANGIESIPTQIFFSPENKELWRHTGFISKEDILKKWKELGFELAKPQMENEITNPVNYTATNSASTVSEKTSKAPFCKKGCQN